MPPPPPGMRPPFMPPVFMQRPTGPQTVFEKGPEIKKQPEKEGIMIFFVLLYLTLQATTPQNSQTHSNNSSAVANELFKCVGPFCGVGA